jgi:hypothetical protein
MTISPTLDQQFFDIAQAVLKPDMLAHRATDCRYRKAMTAIKRISVLRHAMLLDHPGNVPAPGPVIIYGYHEFE